MEKSEIQNLTVRELQNLRLENNDSEEVTLLNKAIIAKLPGSRNIGDFVVELRYWISKDIVDKNIITKIVSTFSKVIPYLNKENILNYLDGIREDEIKNILIGAVEKTEYIFV